MTNRCFCYIRGEYELTVLLLLSGAIKYQPFWICQNKCQIETSMAICLLRSPHRIQTPYSCITVYKFSIV